jgi:Tol biopolymer transport system component
LVGEWSPDSSEFAYRADVQAPQLIEAFVLDRSAAEGAVRLNTSLPPGESLGFAGKLAPDSSSYAYLAAQSVAGRPELWVVDFSTGAPSAPRLASGTLVAGGSLDPFGGASFGWSPDSRYLWFIADALTDGVLELFLRPVTASGVGSRVRVNTALPATTSRVQGCWFSPSGDGLAYAADQIQSGAVDLFYVSLAGAIPGAPERLNAGSSTERSIESFRVTVASSELLVYAQRDLATERYRGYLVPLRGGSAPVPISAQGVEGDGFAWVGE